MNFVSVPKKNKDIECTIQQAIKIIGVQVTTFNSFLTTVPFFERHHQREIFLAILAILI